MIRTMLLTLGLCAMFNTAAAFDLSEMTEDERAAFNAAVREYLLSNPEVIFEAVEVYELRQAETQAMNDVDLIARYADEIFNDGTSWVGGNPDGDVTVVEFLDYRCGFCKKSFPEVEALIAADGNIRLIVKEFPILGEQSSLASRFAIATRNTLGGDAYKIVHDELMVLRGEVSLAALRRIAQRHEFDLEAIEAGMSDPAVDHEIRANYALAKELDVNGTPGFVFPSEIMRGYAPVSAMQAIIDKSRG